MDRRMVVKAHRALYPDPIRVQAGERLVLSGRDDVWDGHRWLWATAPDGREGWTPDRIIGADGCARADYSAVELDAEPGEAVEILHRTHGWAWRQRGEEIGWMPLSHLAPPG